jgi:hypothetical protein
MSVQARGAATQTTAETYVLPFALDRGASAARIRQWLGGGFFSPGDLKSRSTIDGGQGTYVPFWRLDADAHSEWEGEVSETKTRRVQKLVEEPDGTRRHAMVDEPYHIWHPRRGTHEGRHRTWVTASTGLTQEEADRLMPFPEQGLLTFSADLLAGFAAEEPGVDERGAWVVGEARIRELEREACARQIERLTRVQTDLVNQAAALCYLPVWLYTYRYHGRPFRVLVNGYSGEVVGDRPTSRAKVAGAIAVVAVLVLLLIVVVVLTR